MEYIYLGNTLGDLGVLRVELRYIFLDYVIPKGHLEQHIVVHSKEIPL